jgi:hypothetical protein
MVTALSEASRIPIVPRRRRWCALLALALLIQTRPARADEPPPRYFYFGYEYGSQALYNPLWVFINRGFDVLQEDTAGRDIFALSYGVNAANVGRNLLHPFSAISDLGWGTFLREELFPLSFTRTTARWMPNYALHLIGGGSTYSGLREWYDDHHFPVPRVFAAGTLLAAAFLNETIENNGVVGRNTDAIADIYFFDLGGIVLFSFQTINRFFSQTLVISDWSLQPSFTFPRGELHNHGNFYAARWALPFYPRLRLFAWFGEATTAGLSFRLDEQYSISAAAGGVAYRLATASTTAVENEVSFAPTAAIFLDRRESLLASLQISDVYDYFIHLNVYPHAFWRAGPAVGGWAVLDRRAHLALGLSIAWLGGLGVGWTSL